MKRSLICRAGALLVLAALMLALALPAAAEETTIRIRSAEDFCAFAEKCSYDAWSLGKTILLERDISLSGAAYLPAASFSGTFDGGGHTISGLELSAAVAPAGLFGVVSRGAVVRNLRVEGSISPDGSGEQVGGIAGVNHGSILDCAFSGTVSGEALTGGIVGVNSADGLVRRCEVGGGVFSRRMTGGIAGSNAGTITACISSAYVNTNTTDPTVTLTELNLDAENALRRISSPDTYNIMTDSGGIAGFNDGEISACSNRGTVGYQHTGYNVGGIAGRSCGHISGCTNSGSIYGRKDIGGIVGIAEPYVKINLSESSTEAVRAQLDALNALVERAISDASGASDTISARLTAIGGSVDTARSDAKGLAGNVTEYIDSTTAEVNRAGAVFRASLPALRAAVSDLAGAGDSMTAALDLLSAGLDQMDEAQTGSALRRMASELATASDILNTGSAQLKAGIDALDGAIRPADGMSEDEWNRLIYGATDEQGDHTPGALDDLRGGMHSAFAGMSAVTNALSGLASGIADGSIASLSAMRDYLSQQDIPGALQTVADGLSVMDSALGVIRDSSEFETDAAKQGFETLGGALDILVNGRPGDSGGVFWYLRAATDDLALAADGAQTGTDDLRAAVSALRDTSAQATDAMREFETLLDGLSGASALHFDAPGDTVDPSADALYGSLQDISNQLELLNGESKSASDQLLLDIRRINNQFLQIMHTVLGVMDDAGAYSAEAIIEDTSDEDIDAAREGKVLRCVNAGAVSGDIDVGGVAGSMMVYNELNPEGDEQKSINSVIHRTYELKCILQSCTNEGSVTGKRNNVGAVCGDAQLGVISACEAYGSAASESGDYVGGIAGHADNILRSNWSRCTLSGRKYLGGIVGSGSEEGSRLRVSDCRALVEIADAQQYAGAISGSEFGSFSGNRFVSDALAGLDRISVQGQAEPIDYTLLLDEPGLPHRFRSFTLRFVADGAEVSKRSFSYGESFGAEVFPAIPAKDGQYGVWDHSALQDLHFDTTVTAQYFPSVTALASEISRIDSRPVFFVSGAYTDRDALTVSPALSGFTPDKSTPLARLRAVNTTLLEQWSVTVPDDGAETHAVRYLPPRAAHGTLQLYRAAGDGWQRLETAQIGSYLCFDLPAGETDLSLVSVAVPWWAWVLLGALVVSVAALIAALIVRARPKADQTEEQAKKASRFRLRRRRLLLILLALVCVLGVASALLLRYTSLAANQEIYLLLRGFEERRETDMDLTLSVRGDQTDYQTDMALYVTRCEGKRLSCVQLQGIPFYFCDKALLLENGKCCAVGDALPDATQLLNSAATLYRTMNITVNEENDVRAFHAVADTPEAVAAITGCLPAFMRAAQPQQITLDLIVRDGEIERLDAAWSADGAEVLASLKLHVAAREHDLPLPVRSAVASGAYLKTEDAGDALLRLLLAWTELSARDPLSADVSLRADCGPLQIDETLRWQRTRQYGPAVSRLSRRDTSLYLTDAAACTESGAPFALDGSVFSRESELLRLAYEAMLLGDASVETTSGAARYTVTLDGEAMDRFATLITSEADLSQVSFTDGSVSLLLRDDRLSELSVSCGGTIRVVRSDVDAAVSARLVFDPAASFPALPAVVREALKLN